jgi:hypothetical protein
MPDPDQLIETFSRKNGEHIYTVGSFPRDMMCLYWRPWDGFVREPSKYEVVRIILPSDHPMVTK